MKDRASEGTKPQEVAFIGLRTPKNAFWAIPERFTGNAATTSTITEKDGGGKIYGMSE